MKQPRSSFSRRDFLKASSALAGFSILPGHVWASSPNSKLQIAQVGVGGRGAGNLDALLRLPNIQMVGFCDVDKNNLEKAASLVPGAKNFRDYRELLDKLDKDIDAVLIATPDHMHGPIALAAMERGKHVYCEKPLAHNVVENRKLNSESEKRGLVTQLGIQVSSSIGQRMTVEYVRSGLIGKVSEVHVWSNKKWGRDEAAMPSIPNAVPYALDWDLWLGIAQKRVYKDGYYHPGQWRKLTDFGTGTLGDMGVHIFDTPYRALKLTDPLWAKSTCREPNGFSHPESNRVEYAFGSTNYTTKNLKWVWYDGDYAPPTDIPGFTLPEGYEMPAQGCIMIGEKGNLLMPHMSGPRTYPQELIRSVPKPQLDPIDHHGEWIDACLGEGKTRSPFSYGGPLCETLQLGVVASRFPERQLKWNAKATRVSNFRAANQFLGREYRVF
ncbi:MAG: Gfo/Idh/MocA family oxidoreductase [Verrucomicrobia bacterium]|nr:Gfo/Idh/MocA family oxidoreductase [Verrucomicrobiota bacterium]